jgi:mono/diheme cytochrome c family protein
LPLWEFQTGAGVNSPASVFEHDGEQHVVVFSGGNALIGSARGDSVWLFSLNGTLDPASQADTRAVPTLSMAGPDAADADVDNGARVYAQTCALCHGDDGRGGHGGGAPLVELDDVETVRGIVTNGQSNMPAFTAVLTPQQILDVSAYVLDTFGAR